MAELTMTNAWDDECGLCQTDNHRCFYCGDEIRHDNDALCDWCDKFDNLPI